MSESLSKGQPNPQDIVAIFHASFHPTKGNVIDWSLKAHDDLSLDYLEFSALPSGLHLVESDVIYFTKDGQHGVCVFRRRKTTEPGHRGFRLSSLGILLAKSRRPRPFRHVKALKALIDTIYSSCTLEPTTESDWEPARVFFEERKLRRADLGGAGDWAGWSAELDGAYAEPIDSNPTLHLPHILRILGPSSLTLYKHVLGRKRILFYTLPPVEVACILCQVAADLCYETQLPTANHSEIPSHLQGKHKDPIAVLGMVTLADLDRLEAESQTGRGWIACTTDAIFMEKPSYYDLIIDLTASTLHKSSRPIFYSSKPVAPVQSGSGSPTHGTAHRLSTVQFAWSDVKLWTEIDRILRRDSDHASQHSCCGPSSSSSDSGPPKSKPISTWTDAWQVYEDVCILCAGLWMGNWRGNSTPISYSTPNGVEENWGSIRLEGDDDLVVDEAGTYVRNVGNGIEGRPVNSGGSTTLGVGLATSSKSARRTSAMSWSSGKATILVGTLNGNGKQREVSSASTLAQPAAAATSDFPDQDDHDDDDGQRQNGQLFTTMAILQTFHAHALFQLSVMEDLLARQGISLSSSSTALTATPGHNNNLVQLTPKDILAFELGPLSGLDARYLEWLVQEYAGCDDVSVVVRRGWKDLLGAIFGYS